MSEDSWKEEEEVHLNQEQAKGFEILDEAEPHDPTALKDLINAFKPEPKFKQIELTDPERIKLEQLHGEDRVNYIAYLGGLYNFDDTAEMKRIEGKHNGFWMVRCTS